MTATIMLLELNCSHSHTALLLILHATQQQCYNTDHAMSNLQTTCLEPYWQHEHRAMTV
jgi:hypothetical protein